MEIFTEYPLLWGVFGVCLLILFLKSVNFFSKLILVIIIAAVVIIYVFFPSVGESFKEVLETFSEFF